MWYLYFLRATLHCIGHTKSLLVGYSTVRLNRDKTAVHGPPGRLLYKCNRSDRRTFLEVTICGMVLLRMFELKMSYSETF